MRREYKSTAVLVFALATTLFLYAACAVDRTNVTPTQGEELVVIEGEMADARASGDPVAIAAAEAKMDEFEARVLRERGGPIVGSVAAIAPALAPWSPLAMLLLPLLGKRGRKHGAAATKALVKGRLPTFLADVAKMSGAAHSSEDTKAVAEGNKVAVPVNEGPAVQV